MARLLHKRLASYEAFPWNQEVTSELAQAGYTFTHGVVFNLHFLKLWEVMKGDVAVWARAFKIDTAPENYLQLFFPENLKPSDDLLEKIENVCPVIDVRKIGDWIFTIVPAAKTNLTLHRRNIPKKDIVDYVRFFVPQIIAGLTNLLALGYFHGDLCHDNILIDSNNDVWVSGYSLKKEEDVDRYLNFLGPNFRFRSPMASILPDESYDPSAADVWSLGIMIFELLTGEMLVPGGQYTEGWIFKKDLKTQAIQYFEKVIDALKRKSIEQTVRNHKMIPDTAKELILLCLEPHESERPKLGLIADHEFWTIDALVAQGGFSSGPSGHNFLENRPDVEAAFKREGVVIKNQLGKGGFGLVLRVKFQGQYLAMKAVVMRKESDRELIEIEKEIMMEVKHENIVYIIHWFDVPSYGTFFIMELAISDLAAQIVALRNVEPVPLLEERMKKWVRGAALGLQFLHSKGYAHLDFKPKNCLIRPNDQSAVTDFGLSMRVDDPDITFVGTVGTEKYYTPQQRGGTRWSPFATDIYTFGLTALQCVTGSSVMPLASGVRAFLERRPLSNNCKHFLAGCLERNESLRFRWPNIILHPWLRDKNENTSLGCLPESLLEISEGTSQ